MRRLLPVLIVIYFVLPIELKAKTVIINPSKPLAEQLIFPETKYVVKDCIDLGGQTIALPRKAILVIKKGTISNGVIKGNESYITLRENSLENIVLDEGVHSTNKTVKTSFYKSGSYELLESLCNICPSNGIVLLDKDVVYSIKKTIIVKRSITIKGNNHVLELKNPGNCAITAFDAKGLDYFYLYAITIDGSWDSSRPHGEYTDQYLMNIDGVDSVIIKGCVFKNALVVLPSWQEREVAMLLIMNYKNVIFDSNRIINCYSPEGVAIRNDGERKSFARVTNNTFDYKYTSSCLNAYYGQYVIRNNVFGTCRGSALNIFGHDSEIINNTFLGSFFSCAIDLSENGYFNYPSHNINIEGNTAYYCYDGFINGHNISNVTIKDNDINCNVIKQKELLDSYENGPIKPKRGRNTDKILVLIGGLHDIIIKNNSFVGGQALLFLEDDAERKNIKIINNRIEPSKTTHRSTIVFNSVDGLLIKRNKFIGTGSTPGYLQKPIFISTLPVSDIKGTISNVIIDGNEFHVDDDACYVFAQSIYERNNIINFLELSDIDIKNNKCNVNASLIFVDKYYSYSGEPKIHVKQNDFHGGFVFSNTSIDTDLEEISKQYRDASSDTIEYQMNTVVLMNGQYYYVVAGGRTSGTFNDYNDYIRSGDVILHKME